MKWTTWALLGVGGYLAYKYLAKPSAPAGVHGMGCVGCGDGYPYGVAGFGAISAKAAQQKCEARGGTFDPNTQQCRTKPKPKPQPTADQIAAAQAAHAKILEKLAASRAQKAALHGMGCVGCMGVAPEFAAAEFPDAFAQTAAMEL